MPVFKTEIECDSCKGSGLYVGMAERDGAAVVCGMCKGKGHYTYEFKYKEFTKLRVRKDIKQVVQVNPGICISSEINCGGMSYKDWLAGKSFKKGMEMREYTCPAWWYQTANYSAIPKFCPNMLGLSFSDCEFFKQKNKCWERYDKKGKNG